MIIGFKCPKCKKFIKKDTIVKKNVRYMPYIMLHTHNRIIYTCYPVERFEVVSGKCEIKDV